MLDAPLFAQLRDVDFSRFASGSKHLPDRGVVMREARVEITRPKRIVIGARYNEDPSGACGASTDLPSCSRTSSSRQKRAGTVLAFSLDLETIVERNIPCSRTSSIKSVRKLTVVIAQASLM